MIYLVTLLLIIICIIIFDVNKAATLKLKSTSYILLLIWLTVVSAFAYNVGSDTPSYMQQYTEIGACQFNSLSELSNIDNRQPGWLLLNIICNLISHHFVLLKIIIAVFTNYVIFMFIRKHTKYIFVGVLFYFVCLYLNFNFNVYRQAIAASFFLLGYDYLIAKKYFKYYIYALCAFMFHSTAIVCLIFPLFSYIKLSNKSLIALVLTLITTSILAIILNGAQLVSDIFVNNIELLEPFVGNADNMIQSYLGDEAAKYDKLNLFGIISMLLTSFPIILVLWGGCKKIISLSTTTILVLLVYLFLYLLDFVVPVVFMRFVMYIDIIFYCALSDFIIDFPYKRFSPRYLVTILLLCFALFRPIQTLLSENPASGIPLYRQFWPYHSVFNPQIDPIRAINFGYYKDEL